MRSATAVMTMTFPEIAPRTRPLGLSLGLGCGPGRAAKRGRPVIMVVYRNGTVEWIDADVIARDYAHVTLLRGEVVIMAPRLVVVRRLPAAAVITAVEV